MMSLKVPHHRSYIAVLNPIWFLHPQQTLKVSALYRPQMTNLIIEDCEREPRRPLLTQIMWWFQAYKFKFMPETYKLLRLWDRISVYIPPLPHVKQGPRNFYGHFSKKLGLKPNNLGFSHVTIDVRRLWGYFTFDTSHITPLVNGEYKGKGTKISKMPSPIPKILGGGFPFSMLQCLQGRFFI